MFWPLRLPHGIIYMCCHERHIRAMADPLFRVYATCVPTNSYAVHLVSPSATRGRSTATCGGSHLPRVAGRPATCGGSHLPRVAGRPATCSGSHLPRVEVINPAILLLSNCSFFWRGLDNYVFFWLDYSFLSLSGRNICFLIWCLIDLSLFVGSFCFPFWVSA